MEKTVVGALLLVMLMLGSTARGSESPQTRLGMVVRQPPSVQVGHVVDLQVKTYAGVRCRVNGGVAKTNSTGTWMAFPRRFTSAGVHRVTVWCTTGKVSGSISKNVRVLGKPSVSVLN